MATVAACRKCGTEPLEHARFCHGCGSPVEDAGVQAEYKHVTVLFADVVHSMQIAAAVGAERLREIMAELVTRAAAVVHRYGGTVDKFTGDGIMALFGAPIALEDHAVRACRAAQGIQDEAVRLAAEVKDGDGVELQLRVGLNSGQVIAGEIGSGSFGYTAVGEQVGMAQRMESAAPPGGVMLSLSTARLVEDIVVLSVPEMVRIKGASHPVAACRLITIPSHRHGRPNDPTLVGRKSELNIIAGVLDEACGGAGRVIGVLGSPGVGKSRIVRESVRLARSLGAEVFITYCESHTSDVPFHSVAELLRAQLGLMDVDSDAARARVRDRIAGGDPEDFLLLDDLLGIRHPEAALPDIDPDAWRRRLTALINSAWLAQTTAALFVIEDAHWIDRVSESMFGDLLSVVPQTPSAVLVTYRPEYRGPLAELPGAQTISLSQLSDAETAALVDEFLGSDPSVRAIRSLISARAAGNPFFAQEMVRDLAERSVLDGEPCSYRCTTDVAEVTVPATLHATLGARIDRLSAGAKQTLNAAAVIGSRFDAELLASVVDSAQVAPLIEADLMEQVIASPGVAYAFRHPLIRAVAYESQLKSDRTELHRRLAGVIKARDPTSVDENAALIAEHVEAAGDVAEAYEWHMRAGTWLSQRDIAAADRSWERARDLAVRLPIDDGYRTAKRIAPCAMLCANAVRVHAPDSDARFEELLELCAAADDKGSLAFGMAGQIPVLMLRGRVQEASQLAAEYMTLVESIGDPTLTSLLSFVALPITLETGHLDDVLRWSQAAIDAAQGNPLVEPMVAGALAVRGTARWAEGHSRWRDDLDQAIAMGCGADPMVHGYVVSVAYGSAIAMGVMLADDAALANIDDALQVAERSSDDIALGLARMTMGIALAHRDSPAERERGASMLAQVHEMCLAERFYLSELPLIEVYAACERAAGGDRDGALPVIRKAVDDLYFSGQRGYFTWATGILVDTLLAGGTEADIYEAQSAIDRLATGPAGEGVMLREIWLLRLRALLARARGDAVGYRELAQRYRALATSLGFEGHMAMAEAMISSAGTEIVSPPGGFAMPASGDGIPRGRIRRTMPLAGFTARAAGGRIVAGLREKAGDAGAVARFHERTAERYSQLLGHSKGVLMKVGQIFSMFDANSVGSGFWPYQAALARLQADAPPMDPDLAKDMVLADVGRPVEEVFSQFTDEPMAAASIGQVHRAMLHDGREVAVKIQYPGAAEAIRDDLANNELLTTVLRFLSSASGATMPDLRPAAREIATRIAEEVDYRHEAANITAFSDLYRGHPFIRVPDVISEASSDRVLTMTYLDGMDWAAAQRADQDLKNTWAEVISRFMAGSFRHANLFHADPHPGNYRFGTDGRVGFVDFGCVKVLSERQRRTLVGMARAAVELQTGEFRGLLVESGFLASNSTLTTEEAYEWWSALHHDLLAPQPFTYTHDAPRRLIQGVTGVRAADHPVRRLSMPEDFAFFPRLTFGMNTLFATLQATLYARSIYDDLDGVAEPVTPLGKQHHAWVRRRGLPCGLEAHDLR
jgi:adenylate cyclase